MRRAYPLLLLLLILQSLPAQQPASPTQDTKPKKLERVRLVEPDRSSLTIYVAPKIPDEFLLRGGQDRVDLQVEADDKGKVLKVEFPGVGAELANALTPAIQQWQFKPRTESEGGASWEVTLEFNSPPFEEAAYEILADAAAQLKETPRSPEPYLRIGRVEKAQGHFTRAVSSFRRALEMDPDHAAARSYLVDTLRTDLLDMEAAAAELRVAANRSSGGSQYRSQLTELLMLLEDFPSAYVEYSTLMREDPENLEAWCRGLLRIHFLRDKSAEVSAALRQLPATCGTPAQLRTLLGEQLMEAGRLTEGSRLLEEARNLLPMGEQSRMVELDLVPQLRQVAQCIKGKASGLAAKDAKNPIPALAELLADYVLTEDLDTALARERAVLRQHPELPSEIYSWLANAMVEMRGMSFALSEFQKMTAEEPTSPGPYLGLADLLMKGGRVAEGLSAALQAISLQPDSKEAHRLAAQALRAQERTLEAKEEKQIEERLAGENQNGVDALLLLIRRAAEEDFAACDPGQSGERNTGHAETRAVGSLRVLNTALVQYSSTYGSFAPSLAALGPSDAPTEGAADLIDEALASGTKNGYSFTYVTGRVDEKGKIISYALYAEPVTPGKTGNRFFYTDESGVVRVESSGRAGPASPPIH